MAASSARRNKILAMTTDHKNITEEIAGPSDRVLVMTTEQEINRIKTDIQEIWGRPYDYNDFSAVFDYCNEYQNSFRWIQENDLAKLQSSLKLQVNIETNTNKNVDFLLCHEEVEISPLPDNETFYEPETDIFHDSDDDNDKTYVPESSDSDEDNITHNHKKRKLTLTFIPESSLDSDPDTSYNCEHNGRQQLPPPLLDVTEQSNNLVQDETEPVIGTSLNKMQQSKENDPEIRDPTPEMNIMNSDILTQSVFGSESNIQYLQDNTTVTYLTTHESIDTQDKGLTKDGKPRIRKKYNESVMERLAKKRKIQEEKNALKEPCTYTCIKKCSTNFTAQERQDIHDRYMTLNYESQGLFIKCFIDEKPVTRRSKVDENGSYRRNTSYIYNLRGIDNIKKEVCKTFFLSTLGYTPTNDRRIVTAMKKPVDEQKTARGTHNRTLIDRQALKEHIMSYNPAVSHYRREHAPKKLYLPSDLTITNMHAHFCSVNPDFKVSFEVYRKVVKEEMNISFAHLGNEECEQCELYKRHNREHMQYPDDSCEICNNFHKHHKPRYTDSRIEYEGDRLKAKDDQDTIYYSVDLQKIIMLPRMDQFKSAIFCPRIIAFNESFVPLGPANEDNLPYAVLWNECTSGRGQEDIISTFKAFLEHKRDQKHVVLWLDNCSAQNKNWALFCFLVDIVNSAYISTESITLKFFEPGHTFMSADSFHHQVELSLQRKGKVYDFNDFVDSVQRCNKRKNIVKVMDISDFISYDDLSSQHKLRKNEPRVYLSNIMSVKVERGLYKLKYKFLHSEEFKPEALDFLQVKITKTEKFPAMQQKTIPRGITQQRKSTIIEKLVPLMPESRKTFWLNLPTTETEPAINLLEEN